MRRGLFLLGTNSLSFTNRLMFVNSIGTKLPIALVTSNQIILFIYYLLTIILILGLFLICCSCQSFTKSTRHSILILFLLFIFISMSALGLSLRLWRLWIRDENFAIVRTSCLKVWWTFASLYFLLRHLTLFNLTLL